MIEMVAPTQKYRVDKFSVIRRSRVDSFSKNFFKKYTGCSSVSNALGLSYCCRETIHDKLWNPSFEIFENSAIEILVKVLNKYLYIKY